MPATCSTPRLKKFGFAEGEYGRSPDDGFRLIDCRITNAVRCVPPENKPTPAEIAACRPFLGAEIAALPRLEAMLALGAIAHGSRAGCAGRAPLAPSLQAMARCTSSTAGSSSPTAITARATTRTPGG